MALLMTVLQITGFHYHHVDERNQTSRKIWLVEIAPVSGKIWAPKNSIDAKKGA
jgi:hypothetical protein